VPSPRAPEQGAPVARSRVEALDMQAQHNVAMGRLANMVAAEAPGAASQPPHPEERPPVAPAPQGQEPFPLKAIIQR
jgi:hypothetical protein